MTPDTISQTVLFPDLFDKPLVATFDEQHASSDGGGILLKAAERVYGLVKAFAGCLTDKRAPEKIRHTLADVIGQRIFGIACGHPDGNDADHLADDPIHKLLLGRDPVTGARLASQPTISRFENDVRRSALYRMGRELAACVIERHRRRLHGRARRITIDLDPTDDRTHGAQQLTFFNGHYGAWCYLPQLAFLTFDREVEQYLCAAVLRPGKAVASDGAIGLLRRLLPLLRAAFPRVRFLVRLDGGFATPELFDFLDAEPRLDYVVAMAKNAVLVRRAEPAMEVARAQSEVSGKTAHVYTDTRYAARTWDGARRVVIKAEVVRLGDRAPRDNPRFVVGGTPGCGDPGSRSCSTACSRPHVALTSEPVARLADCRGVRACRSCGCGRRVRRPHPGELARDRLLKRTLVGAPPRSAAARDAAPRRVAGSSGRRPSPPRRRVSLRRDRNRPQGELSLSHHARGRPHHAVTRRRGRKPTGDAPVGRPSQALPLTGVMNNPITFQKILATGTVDITQEVGENGRSKRG